jgi:hypothetical protein
VWPRPLCVGVRDMFMGLNVESASVGAARGCVAMLVVEGMWVEAWGLAGWALGLGSELEFDMAGCVESDWAGQRELMMFEEFVARLVGRIVKLSHGGQDEA